MSATVFILGRTPQASLAELDSRLPHRQPNDAPDVVSDRFCIIGLAESFDPVQTIKHLGGTVKIGRLIGRFTNLADLRQAGESSEWVSAHLPRPKHRVEFGVSCVSIDGGKIASSVGLLLKKTLQQAGHSARLLTDPSGELSSVAVAKNGLMSKGFELLILPSHGRIDLAITQAVQPFRSFSERDYGRPQRDPKSGMLPPKLALTMVNLSGAPLEGTLLDPFCGSGTVLQEAWLRGYRHLFASDTEDKAVQDTTKNLAWLKANAQVVKRDARSLAKAFKPESVDTIVTEPDLGPPFIARDQSDLDHRMNSAERLYRQFLISASGALKPTGRIVMILPVFQYQQRAHHLPISRMLPNTIEQVWPFHAWVPKTRRGTIAYERPGQRVGREILILQRRK